MYRSNTGVESRSFHSAIDTIQVDTSQVVTPNPSFTIPKVGKVK